MKVFNFGSINVDMVYRVPHLVQPGETLASRTLETVLGGKGANQSVALARAGVEVHHIGRIGVSDQWATEQMAAAGVGMEAVEQIEGPSGHAIIQVDDHGENSIILHGGANQSFNREVLEKQLAGAERGDWLLMQNECNDIEVAFDIAQKRGLAIAFNPAPMSDNVRQLPLERCSVLIVNETEALDLAETQDADEALAVLAERYPETRLVLTLGSKGALLQHAGNQVREAALPVKVVDTTGAGDTFVGYFLAGLIQGLDEPSALQRACRAAALSVTVAGATPSIPTISVVDRSQDNS
ncbi:ribokinase [Granulosicoccus antarcticus]|uniref:Ribokinase n=1 Tax=Granulosicoccus antarcticus IMCC3135 TaxID=1192854 RepID=A0A2Z2NV83_9GAMM|nr:ribokinase [Granulosicoccus antarcticus]ASJ75452.1 Bifunctional ribokinase/ribose-5-phosphate isomerase A [Granulosicoccus antarcticus IMCC3135]